LHNDVEVGHYSAALKLITVWYIIPQSLMGVLFPLLSKSFEQSTEKFQKIQFRAVKYLMAIALPLAAGTIAIGDQVINWFYGPGFEQSVPTLRILAGMPVLIFLSGILWRTLLARNEQKVALRANIISSIVRLATAVFFIYWLGYLGAAIALASAYAFYVLLHFYCVWQCGTPIPFFQITWRFIVAAVIMGIFSWFLGHIIGVHLFLNIPLSAGVFTCLVFLLQGFTQDDLELVQNIIYRQPRVST
jgi:O-antigen/teichoic acid export membrane protein